MLKTTKGQGNQNDGSLSNQNTGATKTYTCSMHPELISDKPGKCPKCGMELIQKKQNTYA